MQTLLAFFDAPVGFAPGARVHFAFDGPPPDEIEPSLWQADVHAARSAPVRRTALGVPGGTLGWIDAAGGGAPSGWAFVLPSRTGPYMYEVRAVWRPFHGGEAWKVLRANIG